MIVQPTPESVITSLLRTTEMQHLKDFLTEITMSYLVNEDDLSANYKRDLLYYHNTLQELLKGAESVAPQLLKKAS